MKILPVLLALGGFVLPAFAATDAVDAELFPAEFLYKQREAIGVTDDQIRAIGEIMKQYQPVFTEAKRQLDEAVAAMQKLLRIDQPDEAQTEEKMHAVLDCEGEIKMLQLRMLLAIRGELSAEQLGKARQLRDQLIARNAAETSRHERVEKKLEQIREAIKKQAPDGNVPTEIVARAKGIYELLSAGKEADAEKQIDELLNLLGGDKAKP